MDDDETESPSKFRENVKRFLEEQRKAKAKAKMLEETNEEAVIKSEKMDVLDEMKNTKSEESFELDEKAFEFEEESFELEEVSDDIFESDQEKVKEDEDLKKKKRHEDRPRPSVSNYQNKERVFADELDKFKSIPNPDDSRMSEVGFEREVHHAFKKVLPSKVLKSLTSNKCGLCHEEFPRLKEAWRHYRGYNHKRAVKCYVKGTFKGHPPFFKMCLEAIAEDNSAGVSVKDIYKFVTEKYIMNYPEQRTNQLIIWGIERLSENKYIKTNEDGNYYLVDPNLPMEIKRGASLKLPSLEMATSARKERGGPRNFSIISFERKIDELFKVDLPTHLIKTLKPNYCGLCHLVIRENDTWHHYEGSAHKKAVMKATDGTQNPSERNRSPRRSESRRGKVDFSPRDRRDRSDRRESVGYDGRRDAKRHYENDRRRSHHSRDYSPIRVRDDRPIRNRRGRSPSPKRTRMDHSRNNSSPFIHQDSRKLPTAKLPVVFINSSVGGEGPRALVIPKADPTDFA